MRMPKTEYGLDLTKETKRHGMRRSAWRETFAIGTWRVNDGQRNGKDTTSAAPRT